MKKQPVDRPFLTFEQQIHKLKSEYGLIINDYEFAKEALSSFSYYDLINGYQQIYMEDKVYIEGTTIELLCSTHIFNKNIQGVLFKYATYIENTFKTVLSHVIAQSFGEREDEYLKIEHYNYDRDPKKRKKLREIMNSMKDTCKSDYNTPTKHYRDNRNHIPPWILLRNRSFSDATDLFYFLEREEKEIFFSHISYFDSKVLNYSDKVNIALDASNLVRKFRNKIAHNLDFITYRSSPLNKKANTLFRNTLIPDNEIEITRNDIWAMVLSIIIVLNNKYLVHNFLGEFNSFMRFDDEICKIYCNITKIPSDFEKRIITFIENKDFQLI